MYPAPHPGAAARSLARLAGVATASRLRRSRAIGAAVPQVMQNEFLLPFRQRQHLRTEVGRLASHQATSGGRGDGAPTNLTKVRQRRSVRLSFHRRFRCSTGIADVRPLRARGTWAGGSRYTRRPSVTLRVADRLNRLQRDGHGVLRSPPFGHCSAIPGSRLRAGAQQVGSCSARPTK